MSHSWCLRFLHQKTEEAGLPRLSRRARSPLWSCLLCMRQTLNLKETKIGSPSVSRTIKHAHGLSNAYPIRPARQRAAAAECGGRDTLKPVRALQHRAAYISKMSTDRPASHCVSRKKKRKNTCGNPIEDDQIDELQRDGWTQQVRHQSLPDMQVRGTWFVWWMSSVVPRNARTNCKMTSVRRSSLSLCERRHIRVQLKMQKIIIDDKWRS